MATEHETSRAMHAQPISGHHHRPRLVEESWLKQISFGEADGNYVRRYCDPFMITSEVRDTPEVVRVLGGYLVLFRDQGGGLGLLYKHCMHRSTSLEFGIPAERSIRCCHHGWLFDVDGTIHETPLEPELNCTRKIFCQGAYQVCEYKGLILAYMKPPEVAPAFPIYGTFDYPEGNRLMPLKPELMCNSTQITESAVGPIRNAFLHVIVSSAQFASTFVITPAWRFGFEQKRFQGKKRNSANARHTSSSRPTGCRRRPARSKRSNISGRFLPRHL